MSAVLSVGTITSFNASRFATTFLPGIAITHSQTDIERILFENSCKLLKLNDFGFGVIVTEGFWKQTKNQSELFEEISTKEWIDLKSKFDILKNERIFRMK